MNPYGKTAIRQILIQRDGLTKAEADELIAETQQQINELFESDEPATELLDDIIMDNLGLEPDYIDCFLSI